MIFQAYQDSLGELVPMRRSLPSRFAGEWTSYSSSKESEELSTQPAVTQLSIGAETYGYIHDRLDENTWQCQRGSDWAADGQKLVLKKSESEGHWTAFDVANHVDAVVCQSRRFRLERYTSDVRLNHNHRKDSSREANSCVICMILHQRIVVGFMSSALFPPGGGRNFPNIPKEARTFKQVMTVRIRMDQIGSEWIRMEQWMRMDQNGSEWTRMDQNVSMDENGSAWIRIDQNGSEWNNG